MDPVTTLIAATAACVAVVAPAIGRWLRRRRLARRRRDTRDPG